jgi:hypothetical protein
MMAGEATQEDMDKALELLEKNLNDQLERLQALGEQGIEGLLPDIVNFGDPNALLNKLPDALEDQANHTMRQLFEPTKMGYLSSLSSFGPGLFLDTPRMPMPGDPEFDPEAFITVSTITHNLKMYAKMVETQNSELEEEYIAQLNMLHMIYEVDSTRGLVAYRHTENEFLPRQDYANFYKEENRANFKKLALNQIAQTPVEKLIYKPIGFSEDEYFRVNDSGRIISPAVTDEQGKIKFDLRQDPARILNKDSNSNLEGFSFQTNYVVEKQAEKEISALQAGDLEQNQEIRPAVVDAGKQVVITAIKNRINQMQADLFANLNRISTPKVGTEYLGTIRRLFSQANETANENLRAQNQSANELIDVTNNDISLSGIDQNVSSLTLNLQEGALRATVRYNEFPNTKSVQFDPYSVEIYNDNMFNVSGSSEAITLEECDTIPGPDSEQGSTEAENIYRAAIDELGLDLANRRNNGAIYTRRELFARKIMSNLSAIGQKYENSLTPAANASRTVALMNPSSDSSSALKKKLTGKAYSSAMEGIFEQIFFALEGSRIYDEDDYYPGLARRVAGLMTIEGNGDNLCAKNRYNVSQLGLLSFEKMVTDELAKQLSNELSKPENAPQNLDYDSEGPFEKAIKNVCFLGFIRVCLVELLLKGALAYSVWDLEGVIGEKIFESFMFEYIKKELNSRDTMKQNWETMASRITGIQSPETALKKLVRNQSMKMLDVSKKIYQNDPADVVDYHNWYSKYFIPQTHCSRNIAIRQGSITRELSELDIETGQVEGQSGTERTAADKIYWAHPLLNKSNIIIEDIERRIEGSALIDNFSSLVGSNDPFFHVEHLVEVKGPLASIESVVIPGSVITNAILNVDVSRASGNTADAAAVKKITTYISDDSLRSPQRMNVQDARGRTNLPLLNMGDYGFQAVPEQPEGAAGAALEQARQLNAEGEVDPSLYADTTEVFNVKDFKKTLNFKVTDGNMKKFLRHIKGHMYYPDPENGERPNPASVIPDTTHPLLDDFPEEVRRLPTRFIKRTRRVIKFNVDFVSGMFDDFSVDGVELYKRRLYGQAQPSKYIGSFNSLSDEAVSQFRKWRNHVEESVQETTEYFIQPDNAERLYRIFDAIEKKKDENQDLLIELSDENFNPNTGHKESTLNRIIENIPDEANDYLDDLSSYRFTGRTVDSNITRSHSGRYSESKRGFEAPGLIKVDSRFVENAAGITHGDLDGPSLFDAGVRGGSLTTQITENSDPVTIFENKIGKFATKEDYDEAIRLATSLLEDQDPVAVLLKEVEAREEHWVETVYEFSGDGAVLGGIYGSYTIGETMDPAVFSFRPDGNTRAVWQRVVGAIEDRRGNDSIKLFKESPAVSYGRTFWPKAGTIRGARGANDFLGEAVSTREVSIPYIARPMGIDKLTNRRMTSKVLARQNDLERGDFLNIYAPVGRTISLDPALRGPNRYNLLYRPTYTENDLYTEVHLGTRPIWGESPRPDSPDTYFDVCKLLHARPLVDPNEGIFVYPESRSRFLPPNIYRIPLRVLVTQVYIGGNVEKVYSKVVPPKYISNLSDRTMVDPERGIYNDKVTENMSTLNQSIQNICNEYLGFIRDMGPEAGDFEPEFTRDFHFDFKGKVSASGDKYIENRKISAIDLDTRVQYCSIERIYSEAFEIETRQPGWNSKEELDRLFASDRGMLMFKSDPKISPNDLGAFGNHGERVSYLESLNYFYNIPENESLVNNNIYANNFHKIIFSLNNIMQWFLRFRRHDSLWGLLTPQNSSDVTTREFGYGGKQKFPLTRVGAKYSYRDNREFYRLNGNANVPYRSPWQMGFFTEANEPNGGNGLRPTKESFWEGYSFGQSDLTYSKYNTSTSFPEGALCLDHSFSNESNEYVATGDNVTWAKIISDKENNIVSKTKREKGVRDLAVDDPAKYLIPMYRQSGGDSFGNNLLDTIPLMDGFGDYYVNYNRLNGLPLLQNGSPLFVADGRISMDDISKAIKIIVNNIFQGASLESVGATFISTAQNMFEANASFFTNGAGDIVSENFTFIRKVLLSLDPINEIQGAPLSVAGLDSESNVFMEVLENILVQENQSGISANALRDRIGNAIESVRNLLNHLIKNCGTQLRFQTFLEADGKGSIFTSNNESLKQLTIMSRFLESVDTANANSAQKIALLVFLGQYDFAKTVIEFFSPGSGLSQIQKEAEKTWALSCLMWIHLWLAGNHGATGRVGSSSIQENLRLQVDSMEQYLSTRSHLHRDYGMNVRFYQTGNSRIYKISHLRDNGGRMIPGTLFDARTEEAMLAMERILAMIVDVPVDLDTPIAGRGYIKAYYQFKVSGQGLLSHDGKGRHSQRLSPWNSGTERLSIAKLRKFLEGGEWNYDYSLGRPLTNREIINSVYEIIKNFVTSRTADAMARDHDWNSFLFGGGQGQVQPPGGTFTEDYFVDVIQSGIDSFAREQNYRPHEDGGWRRRYTVGGNNNTFDMHHILKDKIEWVDARAPEAADLQRQGITTRQEGVTDLISEMNTSISNRNAFKQSLYGRSVSGGRIIPTSNMDLALPKNNLTLILGRETYRATFPGERSYGRPALEAVKTSPKAARGYTYRKLKTIYNEKHIDGYRTLAFAMKFRRQTALERYTNLARTVNASIFDSAALINNQVMNGLFENSIIDQVCRLVINFNNVDSMGLSDDLLNSQLFQLMSEEQRSILMGASQDMGNKDLSNMVLSVPVAEYREPMSKFGMTGGEASDNFLVSCYSIDTLVEDFEKKTSWMAQELLAKDSSKLFMKYIFPTKRYQAISTIFATTSLSGYTTMPELMRAPKSSLSFLMGISSMSSKERLEMFKNMSQAELFKSLSDNKSSEPKAMKCFDLPFNEDFLDNFLDLLLEQIKEFPAVLFRGLANVVDPAYKEMKMHWDDCDMRNLTYSGWKPFTADGPRQIQGGAHGEDGEKKYASLLVSSVADLGWSIGKLFSLNPQVGARGLAHSVSHITNYIYKGPLSLLDGSFQFQFPCKDVDEGWDPGSQFNSGRYGHPFTPLTYIALAMPELRGDKRLRAMSGRCQDDSDQIITRNRLDSIDNCNDGEDAPFGEMPEPKDFEE